MVSPMDEFDIMNETTDCTSQREKVQRLRAMVQAGERADERISQALCMLRADIDAACERAQRRIDCAKRDSDNLPVAKRRHDIENRVWRIMRQGYSRAVACDLVGTAQVEKLRAARSNAETIADGLDPVALRAMVERLRAMETERIEREATRRNALHAIDRLRLIALQLCPDQCE